MKGRLRRFGARIRSRGPASGSPVHRVVVVGGGFGGLPACRFLAHLPVEVTLIDRRNHHLFQPLLYQVATGVLSPGQIAPALRHILRAAKNVRVELAEVTGFDLDRRVVQARRPTGDTTDVPYDSLIVAAGAGQDYFGHDEFALYAPGMKTIDDALELRRRIFGAFEMAETAGDPVEREQWLTVVVVGAGPTGVEIAGQVRELATRSLKREFRNFDPSTVRVLLLDGGAEPLATFGHNLSEKAREALEGLGVELMMGTLVTGADAGGVNVVTDSGTERIAAHTVVWAAGVHASPLAAQLADATGAALDRGGRIAALPDLTLPGHPEVFAVGDMVTLDKLPGVAEVAMQGGLHAANTIMRRLRGESETKRFRYRDVGSVAAIGRWRAICSVRRVRLSGLPAWVVWLFVHLGFLNGFANRFSTTWAWGRSMVGRTRPERVFSVAHTGGDLSAPGSVREAIQPNPFPAMTSHTSAPTRQE
ncbi:MAG: NAD(P)/FAD-dependent oxidoreductase [Acidimicrobiia bacterium]